MVDEIVTDEQLTDIIEENLDDYKIDNTIPNYVIDDSGPESILKTEIHICPKCMYPDILGSVPFNRREIKPVTIRLDNIVHSSFIHFCKMNKLNQNAGMSLLLRVALNPEVAKMLVGTFSNISKRKGRTNRSKEFITSS